MQIASYLSFNGDCEAAFAFYEKHLGGQIGPVFRYGGSPMEGDAPAGWQDKIMHGSITVGEHALMGADIVPGRYEAPKGFSLSIQLSDITEAERIFRELATDGKVVMPLEKTFWAARFGMVVDRFGIPWLVNCDGGEPSL
ncbi:MAG: VOC family protein [Gemmatimonadota bacterium]